MQSLDTAAFYALYGGTGGGLHGFCVPLMVALTFLGSGWATLALVPLLGAPRTRGFALSLLGVIVGNAVAVFLLKIAVRRPRPCASLGGVPALCRMPTDFSCPSGHAAGSFAVATFLATTLVLQERGRLADGRGAFRVLRTVAAVGALLGLAGAIGVSRVYLGVHFPGDVVAGACVGTSFGVWGAAKRWRNVGTGTSSSAASLPGPSSDIV